jgi:hypothetical protein
MDATRDVAITLLFLQLLASLCGVFLVKVYGTSNINIPTQTAYNFIISTHQEY